MLTETERHDLRELLRDREDEEDGDTDTDDYKTIDETVKEFLCEKSELFPDGIMDLSHLFLYYKDKTLFKNVTFQDLYAKTKTSPLTAKIILKENGLVRIAGVWIHYFLYLYAKYLLGENITVHYKNRDSPIFFEDESRLIVISPRVEESEPEQPLQSGRYMQYLFNDLFLCDCDPMETVKAIRMFDFFSPYWNIILTGVDSHITAVLKARK